MSETFSKRVDDEKYGTMLECHTPALDFYKEKYPVRLGWKKLLQLLPHFKSGAIEAFLAEVAPEDLAALGGEPPLGTVEIGRASCRERV